MTSELKIKTTERMPCGCRWVEPTAAPTGRTVRMTVEEVGGFVTCSEHERAENRTTEYRAAAVAVVNRAMAPAREAAWKVAAAFLGRP